MKKLDYLYLIGLVVCLSACVSNEQPVSVQRYRMVENHGCSDTLIKPRPAPAPVVAQQPVVLNNGCSGCQTQEYTVRTPVQVVYKNTTYKTVYEPKTFESTSYETRPYNRAEACAGASCVQSNVVPGSVTPMVTSAVQVPVTAPAPAPVEEIK